MVFSEDIGLWEPLEVGMFSPNCPSRKDVVFSEDIGLRETLEVSEAGPNYSLSDDSY